MTIHPLLLSLALCAVIAAPALGSQPSVEIAQGRLTGLSGGGVHQFRGIPYAAPPVGGLRWRSPQPPASWPGTRDATAFGAACPQELRPGYSLEALRDLPMQEDCLYLNVWTPDTAPAQPLPVMVWILPGSFLMGDGSMPRYESSALARQGVVAVTFNYRLGILGQFAHPALRRTQPEEPLGNYHLMDQVAALAWVRDNIAAFGGDPDNVTIFGMSAGGVSVNYHLASPVSAGLFHKAISQSSGVRIGRDRHISEDQPGLPSLETEGGMIAGKLGVDGSDTEVLESLRSLTMEQVLEFQRNNTLGIGGSLNPIIDGRLVTGNLGEIFRNGQQALVPYLTGATSWEGSLLGWAPSAEPILGALQVSREQADALYDEPDWRLLNNKLYADFFLESQRHLATLHAAAGQPTWVYFFSRLLDAHREDFPGAAHGAETNYVFQTLGSLSGTAGPGRRGLFGYRVSDNDLEYARQLSAYWVQFARTGDPNGGGRPGWPVVTPGNDLLLDFAQHGPVVLRDFRPERRDFFRAHFDEGRL